jgi:hypothetical protein
MTLEHGGSQSAETLFLGVCDCALERRSGSLHSTTSLNPLLKRVLLLLVTLFSPILEVSEFIVHRLYS